MEQLVARRAQFLELFDIMIDDPLDSVSALKAATSKVLVGCPGRNAGMIIPQIRGSL